MTNQEINERVAKLCGWEKKPFVCETLDDKGNHIQLSLQEWHKKGEHFRCTEKNYTESLDACREFEEAINAREKVVYADLLVDLCGDDSYDPIFATSAIRCEAFLRLKGQWE